ncbi:MAG: fructokinase [Xanthobacteraceae bacterium]|nr:fructokinase [Xanthobacteraceae bacterium]
MTSARYDVLGIGNAIVDVIARAEDEFLGRHGMNKGSMALIDEARAQAVYDVMGPAIEASGGSAANTIVGAASLGAKVAFIGKVKDDELGRTFAHDIRAAGVTFDTPPASEGAATARCYILVTPDGERTMNTDLGAAQDLHPNDIDEQAVADASITYLEGYLWDPPHAKAAFLKAAKIAHGAGRKVALTLSDAFCVGRYRGEFLGLIRDKTADIVFANESELLSLYETTDFDAAINKLQADAVLAVVTRSEKGCLVVSQQGNVAVPAAPISRMVDATGAGDLFAAGFLVGHARGFGHADAGKLGALAAAEVIQHIGARPEVSLKTLAQQAGLKI